MAMRVFCDDRKFSIKELNKIFCFISFDDSGDNNFDTGSQVVPAVTWNDNAPGGDCTILQQPTVSTDILIAPPLVMDSTAYEPVPSFNTTPPSS